MKTTSGYRLVLPPGWVQVPVRDSGPGTAHAVISAAFRKPPEGKPRDAFTSARIELGISPEASALASGHMWSFGMALPAFFAEAVALPGWAWALNGSRAPQDLAITLERA